MKIVFLAHYFPPLNSSGARRVQSFARYLAAAGHQVTVICTKKSQRDGLLTEAIPDGISLLELDGFGRVSPSPAMQSSEVLKGGSVVSGNRSFVGRILLAIKRPIARATGQLVDHRLIYAVQFLYPWLDGLAKKELRDADILMSTSPPWPIHLAGYFSKRRFLKPWVADYRDQFSGSHIQSGLPWFQKREAQLERWFLRKADAVVTISEPMKEYYEQFHPSVFCIQNGYEESLFQKRVGINDSEVEVGQSRGNEIVIRYLGNISSDRIPFGFFEALKRVNQNSSNPIIAEFYGESSLLVNIIARQIPAVKPYIRLCKQLPYAEAIGRMQDADALFFIETSDFSSHSSRGVLTTKLFEYLAARKPIIAEINDKALTASYIIRAGANLVTSQDPSEIEKALIKLREGRLNLEFNDSFIQGLSRRLKAVELEGLLKNIVDINSKVVSSPTRRHS